MSMSNYPGQLIYRIVQYNDAQARRPEDNSINYWKTFVQEYFTEHAIYKYGILVPSQGGGKHFQPFMLPARLLPRYYKSCYQDSMRSCTCILDDPQEFALTPHQYVLECPNARIVLTFDEAQICTYGSLRVTFTGNLKIDMWSFDAHKRVEYLPRASVEAKLSSFMNSISTILPSFINSYNHTTPSLNDKSENNHSANHHPHASDEKPSKSTRPLHSNSSSSSAPVAYIDLENGLGSPEIALSDDSMLRVSDSSNDEENACNTSDTNSSKENNHETTNNNTSSTSATTSSSANNSNMNSHSITPAEILPLIRTTLQNSFKTTSPVNEYGLTPQVMRCFEISDIFLSMEELMDYCLQTGCSPKNAMALWVTNHGVYEQ